MANSLFIAISNPVPWKPYSKSSRIIEIKWTQLGNCNGNQFTVSIDLDGNNIANVDSAVGSYQLNTTNVVIGEHQLSVYALKCVSVLRLSYQELSPVLSGNDMIIPRDYVQFSIGS